MTSGSPDSQPDSSSRNFPSAASTSPEPGTFHFGVSVQGWSDATSDWVVVAQAAQEDVVEVLLHLGLVQLLQDPLFQVLRPFPEGGMRLLAAVGVDLLAARDLLNQVGQEERGARKWLAPSTLYRPQAVRGMPEVPIAPPATARRLSALSPSLFQQGVVGAFA